MVILHLLEQGHLSQQSIIVLPCFILYLLFRSRHVEVVMLVPLLCLLHSRPGRVVGVDFNTIDCLSFDLLQLSPSQSALNELSLYSFDSLILFLHVACLELLLPLQSFQLILVKLSLLGHFSHMSLEFLFLAIPSQLLDIILDKFVLPDQFNFKFTGHSFLLLDNGLILGCLLTDVNGFIRIFQFVHLIFVHFYPFVGVGQFLGQHLERILMGKNALSFFGTCFLLLIAESFLNGFLYFDQLCLQFDIFGLQFSDQFVLVICVGRFVDEQRSVDKLVIHQSYKYIAGIISEANQPELQVNFV